MKCVTYRHYSTVERICVQTGYLCFEHLRTVKHRVPFPSQLLSIVSIHLDKKMVDLSIDLKSS